MLKELKYLLYLIAISVFFFFSLKYYFSDNNKKKSYRSFEKIQETTIKYSENLILLKNDTNESVEYVEQSIDKNKRNYNFWKLITNND